MTQALLRPHDGLAGDYVIANISAQVYIVTRTATMAVDTIYNVEFLRFLGGGPDMPI